MIYLGHSVTNDINDSLVKPVINDFNVKVNTLLAYLLVTLRIVIYKQYCTRFYGSHLCLIEKLMICILLGE